jgi:hypothetical protein
MDQDMHGQIKTMDPLTMLTVNAIVWIKTCMDRSRLFIEPLRILPVSNVKKRFYL